MADKNKKITINELRTFIEAVEFASDSDEWIPSDRQWRRIREMIDRLEESPTPQYNGSNFTVSQPQPPTQPYPLQLPSGMMQQRPMAPPMQPQLPTIFTETRTPDVDTSVKPYESSFA